LLVYFYIIIDGAQQAENGSQESKKRKNIEQLTNSFFQMRNPNTKYATTSKNSSFSHCCRHAKNSYSTHFVLLHARVSKFKIKNRIYFFSAGAKMHFPVIIS